MELLLYSEEQQCCSFVLFAFPSTFNKKQNENNLGSLYTPYFSRFMPKTCPNVCMYKIT